MSTQDSDRKRAAMDELMRMAKANGGLITPVEIVAAARNPDSPLHGYFEWDDAKAAEQHRLAQARTLIRACEFKVTYRTHKMVLPHFVRNPEARPTESGYIETARVRTREDLSRDVLLDEFKRAAGCLRRARNLAGYFDLTAEVDHLIDRVNELHHRVHTHNQQPPATPPN